MPILLREKNIIFSSLLILLLINKRHNSHSNSRKILTFSCFDKNQRRIQRFLSTTLLKRRTSSFAWIHDLRRAYYGSGKEKFWKKGVPTQRLSSSQTGSPSEQARRDLQVWSHRMPFLADANGWERQINILFKPLFCILLGHLSYLRCSSASRAWYIAWMT